jgi:hypothetical protein
MRVIMREKRIMDNHSSNIRMLGYKDAINLRVKRQNNSIGTSDEKKKKPSVDIKRGVCVMI